MTDDIFPSKDPSDRLPVGIDFATYLKAKPMPGDALAAAEWSVAPEGLDVDLVSTAPTGLCVAIIQNGNEGVTYTITCKATTTQGMVYKRSVEITVEKR